MHLTVENSKHDVSWHDSNSEMPFGHSSYFFTFTTRKVQHKDNSLEKTAPPVQITVEIKLNT